MKGDRELCTAAIAQNPNAINYVPDEMKADETFATAFVPKARSSHWSEAGLDCLPEAMRNNERVRKTAGK